MWRTVARRPTCKRVRSLPGSKPSGERPEAAPRRRLGVSTLSHRPLSSAAEVRQAANRRTAQHAWEKSCYYNIDFMIEESATVYAAIQRMAAYNVGCLMVANKGKVTGIISERDYVCKIALYGRQSKDTLVRDVCTSGPNMVVAKRSDSIESCVKKMLAADIRHLPVIDDDTSEVFGLISVKDLVKEYTKEKDDLINRLFAL